MTPLDRKAEHRQDVQRGVHADCPNRHPERRFHIVLRLKPWYERLLESEEAKPDGIYGNRARYTHDRNIIKCAAAIDHSRHLGCQHAKSNGSWHHNEKHLLRRRYKSLPCPLHVAFGEETCESRQKNRPERDTDYA